jgi:hypothetical protein
MISGAELDEHHGRIDADAGSGSLSFYRGTIGPVGAAVPETERQS